MVQSVRGVIARSKGAPVEMETILVPDPGPGEALVAIQACGVCHTDLHYREGAINDDFPFLLGHEAAGIVEATGPGVDEVAPGDFVIINWRAVCGQCRSCARGRAQYCFATHNAHQPMTLADGTELSPALGIGAFVEKTLVAAGQATKVSPEASAAAAGLLGCGVMAGLGAAMNTGGVGRGDSVAVFGCGGVGDAAIEGARLAGASPIIAVDASSSIASSRPRSREMLTRREDPRSRRSGISTKSAPRRHSARSGSALMSSIERGGGTGSRSSRSPSTWNARASPPRLTASSTVSPTETQPGKSGKLTP